jgi:hypothetical protein
MLGALVAFVIAALRCCGDGFLEKSHFVDEATGRHPPVVSAKIRPFPLCDPRGIALSR